MHILFVDPSEIATRVIPAFIKNQLDVGIVISKGSAFNDTSKNIDITKIKLFDLNEKEWNYDAKIVSAVAWSQPGQEFLESISGQIMLANVQDPALKKLRADQYMDQSLTEGTVFIDTLSYKGRHIVMSVWKFINGQWKLFQDFNTDEFVNAIELAWENLDAAGVITGPSQSYLFDGIIKLKFHPTNAAYAASKTLVTRHWIEIWPTIVANEEKNPKKSINTFYEWSEKFGNSKRFTTQVE